MTELQSHPGVPLEKHLFEVAEKIEEFCEEFKNQNELCETARLAGLTHDLGKATGYFQEHLRGKRICPALSSHALFSAVMAVWHGAKDLPMKWKIPLFLSIRSHHSNPTSPSEMFYSSPKHEWKYLEKQANSINLDKFQALLLKIGLPIALETKKHLLPSFDDFRKRFSWLIEDEKKKEGVSLYFTTNLLLGMLVDADIRAVIGMDANEKREELPEDLVDRFLKNLPKNSPIDSLREDFYKTVVQNIKRVGLENKFLSLTAPTGIGKTLAGFSAALRLRSMLQKETGRLPRVIYVLPFTSIIDQNFEVIKRVFKNTGLKENVLLKHHFRANPSTTSGLKIKDVWEALGEKQILKTRDAEELLRQYKKAHNRVETWDGEVIVTTFVRFFETLFTNRRSEMRRLHRLAGSIVILDEVQNIPVNYWTATEEAIGFLAEQWDTRFILMTATRPALLKEAPELTEPHKKRFFTSLSRTALHIEGESKSYTEIDQWLLPKLKSAKSFMVVMNTVRSAQEVYNALKERLIDFKLYFLSASLIPIHREKRIEEIKKKVNKGSQVGLIATQVVEAGVDLDFDIVIRDLAPLDSVVQAAGRCNRNFRNETGGDVFLVSLINPKHGEKKLATYIYDGVIVQTTEDVLEGKKCLQEKEYLELVEEYFRQIGERAAQRTEVIEDIRNMNFREVGSFSLIEKRVPQIPVFVEFDEQATVLIERLKALERMPVKDYEERMKRRDLTKSLTAELWAYIVNVPIEVAANAGLEPLPYFSSFLWLAKEHPNFREIYREDTGFVREIDHTAFFL